MSHTVKEIVELVKDHEPREIYVIEVKVKDKGIGIDKDEAEKLFKPFSKLKNKKSRSQNPGGNGLGLSICK